MRSSNNLKSATFSSFPRSILTKLLKCTKYCLDLCFDVYESPSIKDVKRKARGDNEVDCYFTFGPKQSLPSDFEALLQISEYKSQFLRFLMKEYEDGIFSHIGEKFFYCSIDSEGKRLYTQTDNSKVELVPDFFGSHLEGDTRFMLHALHSDRDNRGNIVVRANDTDVIYNVNFIENSNM